MNRLKIENLTVKPQKPVQTVTSDGYSRAKRLMERCSKKTKLKRKVNVTQAFRTRKGEVQMCPIWKVGSHTFRRLFLLNSENEYQNMVDPYNISWDRESSKIAGTFIINAKWSKRYLFVRNPYERLFAVYVDKVLAPNTVFWNRFGIPAIRLSRNVSSGKSVECGHDATFSEYAKFVIAAMTKKKVPDDVKLYVDPHFAPFTWLCNPCSIKYDFIGKMETFKTDVMELISDLHLGATKSLLEDKGSELTEVDSVKDTAYQPFDPLFTETLGRCIGKFKSLERAWLKLQIRGLIGNENLPLEKTNANEVTYDQFLQMALKSREQTPKMERKQMKTAYLKKYFNTLDIDDLSSLLQIYYTDLHLFEYEQIQVDLFV